MIKYIWFWSKINDNIKFNSNSSLSYQLIDQNLKLKNIYSSNNRVHIGINCYTNLVIDNLIDNLNLFIDNFSKIILNLFNSNLELYAIISNYSNLAIKFYNGKDIKAKIIVGPHSKVKILFTNAVISSKLSVHIQLFTNAKAFIISDVATANCLNIHSMDNMILGKYATIKIVYNILILKKSYVIICPNFNFEGTLSVCSHSINVNNNVNKNYIANRLIDYIDVSALAIYNKYITPFD